MAVLGIDVAKATLVSLLISDDGKRRRKACANTPAGHAELVQFVARYAPAPVRVGLEATGTWGDAVATALHDAGHDVARINPTRIEAFARAQPARAKTDRLDAELIAHFVTAHELDRWTPPPVEWRTLQALVRRLDVLHDMRTQEINRREAGLSAAVQPSIAATIAHLDDQIATLTQQIRQHFDQHPGLRAQRDLLTSIPGIGETTAALLLAELGHIQRFTSARQVAAFSGLVPRVRESGTSVRGRGTLALHGSRRLRKALFFPALVAARYNPLLHRFAARLRAAGKPKMVVVAAVMRKLLHQVYGILRSGRAFNPHFA